MASVLAKRIIYEHRPRPGSGHAAESSARFLRSLRQQFTEQPLAQLVWGALTRIAWSHRLRRASGVGMPNFRADLAAHRGYILPGVSKTRPKNSFCLKHSCPESRL